MRPPRFVYLAGVSFLIVLAFAHKATAQTDPLSAEIHPVVEQYFRAIAAGDTETTLALVSDRNHARGLLMMRGIKALIDANGGLHHVETPFPEAWSGRSVSAWAVLVFNNGRKEISAQTHMVKAKDGHWRFSYHFAMGFLSGLDNFYHAIANGDTEKALTWVSFSKTHAGNMINRKKHITWVIDIIKHQMDTNGGLIGVGPLQAPPGTTGNNMSRIHVPVRLFFNNKKQEASLSIHMEVDYGKDGLWRLDAEDFLPVAFTNEIKTLIESSYQAAFSGNATYLIENSVITGGKISGAPEKQKHDIITRKLNANITQMQQQAEANGGLKRFEIKNIEISVGSIGETAGSLAGTADVTLVYNNDKTDAGHITFPGNNLIFHQGQWKLTYWAGY